MAYDDHRLAAIYDADNPDGDDHDYYRALADRVDATQIVDLGCGTGILTVTLASPNRNIVGIDPAPAMLDYAAARPGGDTVEWKLGTSELIDTDAADLVVMSGNVAMHIIGDAWHDTLADIARGLRPGGTLAFESRNPATKAWIEWNDELAERTTSVGQLRESTTTTAPDEHGVVTMYCHNEFVDAGGVLDVESRLQFRTGQHITADLKNVGLEVRNIWRDWTRTPFTDTPEERFMVFEAVRVP